MLVVSVLGAMIVAAGCAPGTGSTDSSQGEASQSSSSGNDATTSRGSDGSDSESTTSSTSASTSAGSSGASSSGDQPELTPAEQAARLACAAREVTDATELPAPMMGSGFRFGEYPARFLLDYSQAESPIIEGELWCHTFGAECVGCDCPLNDCRNWADPDGETRIHMVTRGIDHVEFYGSDEPVGGAMYAPLHPSARYEVGDECPDLPQVWTPAGEDVLMYASIHVVCMHHSEDVAEVVFVRIP